MSSFRFGGLGGSTIRKLSEFRYSELIFSWKPGDVISSIQVDSICCGERSSSNIKTVPIGMFDKIKLIEIQSASWKQARVVSYMHFVYEEEEYQIGTKNMGGTSTLNFSRNGGVDVVFDEIGCGDRIDHISLCRVVKVDIEYPEKGHFYANRVEAAPDERLFIDLNVIGDFCINKISFSKNRDELDNFIILNEKSIETFSNIPFLVKVGDKFRREQGFDTFRSLTIIDNNTSQEANSNGCWYYAIGGFHYDGHPFVSDPRIINKG